MNAMVIVFFVVIFLGATMFLFMISRTVDTISQDEYMNMYTNNLLITLLRTDTGFESQECKTMSDIAFYGLLYKDSCRSRCGLPVDCLDFLREKINNVYLSSDASKLSFNRIEYNYLLTFSIGGSSSKESFGDESLNVVKKQKWSAEANQLKMGSMGLNAKLIVAKNEA